MTSLLTISELSQKIKVAKSTIYEWTSKGEIPHIKLQKGKNGSVRFDEAVIEKWLKRKEIKAY